MAAQQHLTHHQLAVEVHLTLKMAVIAMTSMCFRSIALVSLYSRKSFFAASIKHVPILNRYLVQICNGCRVSGLMPKVVD